MTKIPVSARFLYSFHVICFLAKAMNVLLDCSIFSVLDDMCAVACVAWRFWLLSMTVLSIRAPVKFARKARVNERRSREKIFQLLLPQSPRGFSALARLYYLATKSAMLRRLCALKLKTCSESDSSVSNSPRHSSKIPHFLLPLPLGALGDVKALLLLAL